MSTEYLNPTGPLMAVRLDLDLCPWCGAEDDPRGCFCRHCDSCSAYWKDSVRRDYNDGLPAEVECPDCAADYLGGVKTYVKVQFKLAPIGSDLESYYFDALTELILIERDLEVEVPIQTIELVA